MLGARVLDWRKRGSVRERDTGDIGERGDKATVVEGDDGDDTREIRGRSFSILVGGERIDMSPISSSRSSCTAG
jgi:hypothetical protein